MTETENQTELETAIEFYEQVVGRYAGISRYSGYHAAMWSIGKTDDEIRHEIALLDKPHTFKWNEIGSEYNRYSRIKTLEGIRTLRAGIAI